MLCELCTDQRTGGQLEPGGFALAAAEVGRNVISFVCV